MSNVGSGAVTYSRARDRFGVYSFTGRAHGQTLR